MQPQSRRRSTQGGYEHVADIGITASELLLPPERLEVHEAAEKFVRLNNPGAYVGPYDTRMAPYMREPMDALRSRLLAGVVFVGPAQCSKTESLILCWAAYSVRVDPMDMMIFCPTMSAARDFSIRRLDRLHRHSPEIGAQLMDTRDADNKTDKRYKSGMILTLSYPSVSEFAGRPVPRVALTDYDRMPDDVEGEGSPFDLGMKRNQTYGSFGMTLAESSPSRPVANARWMRRTPHEAPPCEGILGLYNRGDRRRWLWPCQRCGEYFEGAHRLLRWQPDVQDPVGAGESATLECLVCGKQNLPGERSAMQAAGLWLRDLQTVDREGRVSGKPLRSNIGSWWLNGTAAAFMSWPKLVTRYMQCMQEYERTGAEEPLRVYFNTDLGEPYITKSDAVERLPDALKDRAEPLPEKEVPPDCRALVACVDVQRNAFIVQVHGILPGEPYDLVLVDRFSIFKSRREDADGDKEWVKPATYLEDWQLLTDMVLLKRYPLADGSGRTMGVHATACDSGGKAGVTTNAYNYYRALKGDGLAGRFHLVKGTALFGAPRVRRDFPDSGRKDKLAGPRGDIPVLFLNSNLLKDELAGRLESVLPGQGMIRYPDWLPDWFYSELCVERKTDKGWINPSNGRNEAWDLLYYCLGLCASSELRVEKIDWEQPPKWLSAWDANSGVSMPGNESRFTAKPLGDYNFARFGADLA